MATESALWQSINALGGVPASEYDRGFNEAIGQVLTIVEAAEANTTGLLELYPDANDPTGLDIGGDEFPRIRPTATTFGSGFPDPADWLAKNAPSGWLIEAEIIPEAQTKAA